MGKSLHFSRGGQVGCITIDYPKKDRDTIISDQSKEISYDNNHKKTNNYKYWINFKNLNSIKNTTSSNKLKTLVNQFKIDPNNIIMESSHSQF